MTDPTTATLMPLADLLFPDDIGQRVRVVGYLIAFDASTSLGVVSHGGASLLVDFALCLAGDAFRPRLKGKILVIGELEPAAEHYPHIAPELLEGEPDAIPPLEAPHPSSVLRALMLQEVDDLDLTMWETAARLQSVAMQERARRRRKERAALRANK